MACPLGKLTIKSTDPRINYNLLPGEELMTCPYNPSHAILPIKFHRHVNNCHRLHCKAQKEKGKPVLFSICQWDRSHHLPHALLAEHEATCKGRLDVEDDWGEPLESVAGAGSSGGGAAGGWTVKLQEPPKLTEEQLASVDTEDWDADAPYAARFDPEKRIHELRSSGYAYINTHDLVGLTKSEKKEFYAEEERKLRCYQKDHLLMQKNANDPSTSSKSTSTATPSSYGEEDSSIPE